MGTEVSIDKHTTPIEEWYDVTDKLETSPFEQDVSPHLAVWKIFPDELNPQEFNSLPVEIELNAVHQLISPHEAYLVCAIKGPQLIQKTQLASLAALINSIRQNIEPNSARTPLLRGQIEESSYAVYAYLGKLSKPKIRLVAMSYALKMQGLLSSSKKLAILSAGGVLRNKKLQKGSTLSLFNNVPTINRQISEYEDVHVFEFFWGLNREKNPLLNRRSTKSSPFIVCNDPSPRASAGVKPPLLKLSLKPFEEATYSEIEQEQKNGEIKFDIRATARHELKMEKFKGECNQILDGIFVSGERVAKSWELLEKHQIKAVINCAGDYCQNWCQDRGVNYLTYFLKDSQNENIECLFYRSIEFIQTCQKNRQNVLVHCIQGISRSITIVIAYIMFKLGYDYKKAELFVKEKRGIACPNNGFMVELIQFHKRLYQDYTALPSPRVFLVSSHSKETPNLITARLIKQILFDSRKYLGLDCRGIYIVHTPEMIYVWVGSKCEEKRLQSYWSYAQDYVKKLQKYERAPIKLKAISQGTEGKDFLSLWNLDDSPNDYQNSDYDRLFCEGETAKPGGMRKFYERELGEVQEETESNTKLFIFPDFSVGLGVFEFQDLSYLSVLASVEGARLKVFICRDDAFEGDDVQIGEFLQNIIKNHYGHFEPQNITIEEENPENASEAFMEFFN